MGGKMENEYHKEWSFLKIFMTTTALILGTIMASVLFFGSWYTIPAGERGIVLTFGNPDMIPTTEGLHSKVPLIQKVIKMDIKTLKYEAVLSAASKDLQDVSTTIAINYHLIPENVPKIYKEIGLSYENKIIYPFEQEINKGTTALFTAEELVTRREEVRTKMKELLYNQLLPRNIIVEEVSITNFEFSKSFSEAIEKKVTAEQEALGAKNKLEQIKYEAQQRITQATAEAEAIQIQAKAIQMQGGKEYIQLQAISKWDGKMPFVVGGGTLPMINLPIIE
jgi:regulator of protease activity HflC (stomatin/prohibitin superfamily)